MKIDEDSELSKDMKKQKISAIELQIKFDSEYPFSPPFVRLTAPVITGGYVLGGGAICLELLTKDGWSSAYSIESVIMQIGSAMVKVNVHFLGS